MHMPTDVLPSVPFAVVEFVGAAGAVRPSFFDDTNWEYIRVVKATKWDDGEWTFSTEMHPDIDPGQPGFWQWGDVLIYLVQDTILESTLYVYRRKEGHGG